MSLTEEVSFDNSGNIERFSWLRKLFLAIVIILVALLSFGIGRLSVVGKREPIRIEYDPLLSIENSLKIENSAQGAVVGSKNGSKYHYPNCPGAKQISEKNKVTFSSANAAEAAGYTLASNCK
ncbi:MAG: hypothetical protein HYS51_00705 [Candidatus Zambryskibacteria bacterium]|nr:hypothetical protein [Candidatus Zambryskibacteria bacterium]